MRDLTGITAKHGGYRALHQFLAPRLASPVQSSIALLDLHGTSSNYLDRMRHWLVTFPADYMR